MLWVGCLATLTVACAPGSAPPSPPAIAPSQLPASPLPTDATTDTPIPFNPSIDISGEPEVVYNWQTDHCGPRELADLPARAIRNAEGQIELYVSSTTNYRLVGADFNSLTPDCNPVMTSDFERDPSRYSYAEWMGAPYTLDGNTVYAIIHQEYHGDQAGSVWQAGGDFSDIQGAGGWTYLSASGSGQREMHFDAADQRWQGSRPLCQITAQGMHPDLGCDPTRAWTSPVTGPVTISGRIYDQDAGGGNGVVASITRGNQTLWSATIENGDSAGQAFEFPLDVAAGEVIEFSISARGDNGWDSTFFDPGINVGPAPCPSGRHDLCTLISLTYAVSTDGGRTFTQPAPPGQLIATPPYQYDPDWMRSLWQPSNIVLNPGDGYYYALIQRDEHSGSGSVNVQGMCLMRTQALDDPASWRAWDGGGFNLAFVNPYLDPGLDPSAQTCALVSPELGALTYGLSYNTYFEQFIAIGVAKSGFFYSLSEDLIHWSPRQLLMPASQTFDPSARPPYLPYPTLIDHDSPSASFDITGQTPYLYYSRFNGGTAAEDTDILRVRVSLSR